jgi:hypothetical protein
MSLGKIHPSLQARDISGPLARSRRYDLTGEHLTHSSHKEESRSQQPVHHEWQLRDWRRLLKT